MEYAFCWVGGAAVSTSFEIKMVVSLISRIVQTEPSKRCAVIHTSRTAAEARSEAKDCPPAT